MSDRWLIVAGSRAWTRTDTIAAQLARLADAYDGVMTGGCPSGADYIAKTWCQSNGVPLREVPADWGEHGRSAGPIRNAEMASLGVACMVFQVGDSRGSASMIAEAKKAKIPLAVYWRPEDE